MLYPKYGCNDDINPSINYALKIWACLWRSSDEVYSPQAIVAAGHDQRAISVKMDLKPKAHNEKKKKIIK